MSRQILSNQDFNSVAKIVNLPDPSSSQDAATKAYVDASIEGLSWKDGARVATQGNVSIASPGATIDGVTMAAGDRVLVMAQTTGSENGIYIWNGAAVAMTRALDANTAAELEQAILTVEEGTSASATTYEYCVDTSNNNSCDTSWVDTSGATTAIPTLAVNTTYYWQVRAVSFGPAYTYANGVTWWVFSTSP